MSGSAGGVGDSFSVEVVGWEERRLAEEKLERDIRNSVPPCPWCGGVRVPMKQWDKTNPRPKVACRNLLCTTNDKHVWEPDEWEPAGQEE